MSIEVHGHANTDPTVAHEIPNQSANLGDPFSYQFPANTFSDADGDTLTYSATAAGGGPLPAWLSFTASSRTFSGTAPSTAITVSVKVTASDGTATVDDIFTIMVKLIPSFSSATVNGTTLKVTFSENLDATSRPFGNQMWVTATKNGATRDINGGAANRVSISGKTVTMTLVDAIVAGETVVIHYRKADNPASVPLRNAAGTDVPNFSDKPVTNNTGVPELSRAVIFSDGFTKLRLIFDRDLAAAANLANDAFAVKRTPDGGTETDAPLSTTVAPSISGKTVTLTLASAVATTDAVKVSYTKPTTGTDNTIKSTAGAEAASFSDQAVTVSNNRPPVFTPYVDGLTTVSADMWMDALWGSLLSLPFKWSAFSDPDGDTLTRSTSTTRSDVFVADYFRVVNEAVFMRHRSHCAVKALDPTVDDGHVTVVTLTVTDPHGESASAKRRFNSLYEAAECSELESAAVDGAALTLTYEVNADLFSALPDRDSLSTSEFTVEVDGTEVEVTAISGSGVNNVITDEGPKASVLCQKSFHSTS